MKDKLAMFAVLLCGLFSMAGAVSAHHGGSAYDPKVVLTLKGKVTSFKFINPHVQLYFDVTDDKGNVVSWSCESPDDPAMLDRQGWNRNIIQPGDIVTVVGRPAKGGAKVLSMQKVILADGRELDNKILN